MAQQDNQIDEAMLIEQPIPIAAASVRAAAPGPYLGFGLQPVRLCTRLLTGAQSDMVSTEFLDDIAVRSADDSILLEQTKSALSHNPVSDWAQDLWKTFSTWIVTIQQLSIDPSKTRYVLYICPSYTGNWISRLHNAHIDEQVEGIVADIRKALEERGSLPSGSGEYLTAFLNADPALRTAIVRNFTFVACAGDPVDEIRDALRRTVSPEILDDVCKSAIGWVKVRVDERLRDQAVAEISVSEFQTWFHSFLRRHDRDHVLRSFAQPATADAVQQEIGIRTYIRQLDVIELDSDEKVNAASDYLMSRAERTIWSARGVINETSLNEFDQALTRAWSLNKNTCAILHAERPEIIRGKLLYFETFKHNERLQGMDVPRHFTAGAFHGLADIPTIGWHPRYAEILKESDDNA